MVGVEHSDNPLVVDISAYILTEYVPAKPLESNLEVVFSTTDQALSEKCGQLNCGDNLKFPFARAGYAPTAVYIQDAKELVVADAATETKRVVELSLNISSLGEFDYEPGDTVAILPSNDPHVVAQLLHRLDIVQQADSYCLVRLALNCAKKSAKVPAHLPTTSAKTPREILTDCLSLHSVLQKQFLSALARCTSDSKERAFLASLSSKQGTNHYQTLILERGLCMLDLLELCASCQPTLALLVEHLPRLLPRPYSISNSPLECSKQMLRIIYSIRTHKAGVTTAMLEAKIKQHEEQLQQPVKLFLYPRIQNAFRYTDQELTGNQILIAVGTGLAPFLGFLAHKQRQQLATGETWLYVGAKTPQAMLKQQQLLDWQASSILQRLRLCYSRSSTPEEPKYVQQLLEEDAEQLVELLLQPSTILYVCADGAKISKSIEEGLRRCLQLALHLDEMEAVQRLKELRTQGKYREDLWL
ncbi:methionine synthase reductase [Drosophila grimshawi]|uniref:Methionine synthase reductase n=1 Tax=Drosophila grimshawi TaxID=7222 RepID=B4JFL5_DROGR|nr:methionine synthase reductase [Drosophila grimshawi]EDV93496.1 GH19344 [Drosophila grimshawi]